ncbi:MAG TPA: class F sortase [Actinophytocola sp.]|nr:class F sortase [Actinophytocola sp.]
MTSTTTPASAVTSAVTSGAGVPVEVRIPAIGATSSLMPLGLNPDRTVEVPPVDEPMRAGWFTGGPAPGEPGPAVLLGHVNGGGRPGIFARLAELEPGDEVLVRRTDDTVRFTVRRVDQVPKTEFPADAVYGDTPGPELRLITCGGAFDEDAGSYRDNVIVYALPS